MDTVPTSSPSGANRGRTTAEPEHQLPHDVPILSEPFTAEQLRAAVRYLLAS